MSLATDSTLDSLHATANEIFTGAIGACNIATAFDRRIRFEGNTLHRLIPTAADRPPSISPTTRGFSLSR